MVRSGLPSRGVLPRLHALSSGRLVSIAEQSALVEVDPTNGALEAPNQVPFDSGNWIGATFTVDPS